MSISDPYGNNRNSLLTDWFKTVMPEYMKDNVRTSVPGHILSFDPATQLAEVQIGLMIDLHDSPSETRSPLVRVPVIFPGAAGGTIEFKISRGDPCAIHFSQECIDSWVDQGGVAVKSETRRFDINDAYCLPGLRSVPEAITGFANEGIRLRNKAGTSYFWIRDDGTLEINGLKLNVLCPTEFKMDVDTMAALRNFLIDVGYLHQHSGVQPGTGISGVVVP